MATGKSTYATALASVGLHDRGNQSQVNRQRGVAKFEYTTLGTELVNEYIDLGPICVPCQIIPEEVRARFGGSGAMNITGKLQKVSAAGVVTDLTGAANTSMSVPLLFPAASSGALPIVEKGDRLRFTFTVITIISAGRVLLLEVGYDTI